MSPGEAEQARRQMLLAREALRAAQLLLGEGLAPDAASRLYYAVFHAARGVLVLRGIHTRTHSGLITRFTEAVGPAPVLGRLLALRADADYSMDEFAHTVADVEASVADTEAFLERCQAEVDRALARGPDEADPPADL